MLPNSKNRTAFCEVASASPSGKSSTCMKHTRNDTDRGIAKYAKKILFQCHFVHHKSHMDWPETEPATGGRQTAWGILRSECGGTRWRKGGEVKGKLVNGVGSQYSHTPSEGGVSSITKADAHTSAASSRLNWLPRRFKWIRPFRRKTKCGFCACAIRFRTSSMARPRRSKWKCRSIRCCLMSDRALLCMFPGPVSLSLCKD